MVKGVNVFAKCHLILTKYKLASPVIYMLSLTKRTQTFIHDIYYLLRLQILAIN